MGRDKSVDLTFRLLAVNYLDGQRSHLENQLNGVGASDDIEFIHQARVASRRLRVALQIFKRCFEAKKVKIWQREIRALTKGLGDARDRDVQIEFLQGKIESFGDKEVVAGLERLMFRLTEERTCLEPGVVKAVKRLRQSRVLTEMAEITAPENVDVADRSQAIMISNKRLKKRLGVFLLFLPSLEDEMKLRDHHQLRIAAKKFRYSMEIVGSLYDDGMRDEIKTVKKLQAMLGGVHDCDFWIEKLAQFSEVAALKEDREVERRRIFSEVQAFCGGLEQMRYWQGFEKRL